MTELERRALLGDRQAQEECTEKGIVLPCPCCGSDAEIVTELEFVLGEAGCFRTVKCKSCFLEAGLYRKDNDALNKWNTRPAPPIGRCGECKYYKPEQKSGACLPAECDSPHSTLFPVKPDTFCSYFKPREEK